MLNTRELQLLKFTDHFESSISTTWISLYCSCKILYTSNFQIKYIVIIFNYMHTYKSQINRKTLKFLFLICKLNLNWKKKLILKRSLHYRDKYIDHVATFDGFSSLYSHDLHFFSPFQEFSYLRQKEIYISLLNPQFNLYNFTYFFSHSAKCWSESSILEFSLLYLFIIIIFCFDIVVSFPFFFCYQSYANIRWIVQYLNANYRHYSHIVR